MNAMYCCTRFKSLLLVGLFLSCGCGAGPHESEQPVSPESRRSVDESFAAYEEGVRLLRTGKPEKAESSFRSAIDKDAGNHSAWFQLGVLAEKRGAWADAIEPLTRAVRLEPKDSVYAMHLGRSLLENGKPRAARAELERSVRIERGQYQAHYFLGRAREAGGDFRGAAQSWTEAARAEPCFAPSFVKLADLYHRWGFHARALVVAEKGVSCASPRGATWRLWSLCGQIHERSRENDDALVCYGKALLQRVVPGVLLRRARLRQRLGFLEEARSDYRQYLRLPEASSWNRRVVKARLKELETAASGQR